MHAMTQCAVTGEDKDYKVLNLGQYWWLNFWGLGQNLPLQRTTHHLLN